MEEMTIGSSSQSAAPGMSSSANDVRLATVMSSGGQMLEDEGTVLDSGIVPFFDTNDGSQIIFKGILDSNGSVILDPSFLMSGISIDGIVRDGNFSFATITHPQVSSSNVPSMGTKSSEHHFDGHHLVQISDEFVVASSTQDVQHITHSTDPNRFLRDKSSSPHQNVIVAISSNNSSNMSSTRDDHQTETIPVVGNGRSSLQPRHNLPIKVADDVEPPIRKGPHICSDCGKSFLKWPQFKRHKAEHLDEKSFRCSLCSMSFNFESNLTLHVMIHEAEANGSLECKMCPAKFTRMASLRSHVRVHEKDENLVCPECGDEFATKARLENHIDEHNTSHTKSLFYRCKLCGKSFNQAALLKDHSKEHVAVRNQLKILHPRRRKPVQPKATSNSFNLQQSQVTNTPLEEPEPQPLSKAKQRKDQKKKLNCSVCSKRFEKPSQLSRHMRIHTGEKPFECPHCRRSFNQKCTLESHILSMHDKLKPFVCHLCNSSFSQRGNLKAHVLKVHVPPGNDDKYFKCEECPCVYRRIATLNAHIAKFHTKSHKKLSTTNAELSPENMGTGNPVGDVEATVESLSETADIVLQHVTPDQQNNETTATESEIQTTSHDPHLPVAKNTELSVTSSNISSYNLQEQTTNDDLEEETTEVSIMHETEGSSKKVQVKVKKIGADKWHLCPFDQCPKAFKKPSDLVRHIRVHTQERPYRCDQCGKSFAVKSTLRTHSKTHAEVKDWECRICRKQFSVLNSLKTHERLHTGAKPFHCLQCSKCFRTSSQRRMHMRVHARNAQGLMMGGRRVKLLRIGDNQPTQKVDLPDPLKITSDGDLIPVPNRTSGSMLKVTNEMMEEGSSATSEWTKSRPYKCTQCPSAFKKSSHLKQHLRSHTGERPYKCFQCYRNFISSGVLKNHIKTHEGVRAHKCGECQLTFTTNGSLKRHMVSVHSDLRSFVCPYCHKTFKTSVQCRKHIKTHRNELLQLQSKRESAAFQAPQVISSNKKDALNPQESYPSVDPTVVSKSSSEQQIPADNSVPHDEATDQDEISDQRSVVLSMCHHQSHPEEDPNLMDSRPMADNDPTTESLQIQDITELMNNGHELSSVTAGDVTQYSLQSSTLGDGSHHRMSISLGDGQTYDGPIFALQSGDSIDLTGSLSQIMPSASLVPTASVLNVSDHSTIHNAEPEYTTDPDKAVCDGSSQAKRSLCDQSNETNHLNNQENNSLSDINVNVINMGSEPGIDIDSSNIVAMSIVTDVPAHDRGKVNVCSHCGRGFKKRSDLLRHFRIHTGEKPYKCHICGKAFRVKSTRESHLRTHEGGKSVSCNICNNMFSTKSSLNVHLRLHTGIKPYKCPHCDKHFRTSGHRKAHQQWHIKAAREASKNSQGMLAPRQNQNHSLLPPVQTIRGKSSNNANLGNQVMVGSSNAKQDNHSTEDELITGDVIVDQSSITNSANGTSICYVTSGTDGTGLLSGTTDPVQIVGSLQLTLDSGLPNVQITGLDLNTLQLSDDFLQSLGNVIFMTHPNHSNGSSHTDPLTGAMVGQTISVLTGKDLNIGSTALVGNSNVTTFGDLESIPVSNSELVHGYNAHNSPMLSSVIIDHKHQTTSADKNVGIPNNKHCSVCGKTFAKPSLLKRHMTTHTGEKPFKCKQCGCAFNQKNSLDAHMFTHGDEDERPFACSLCPFRTVLKTALKKHCLRAHKDAWNESMITPISTSKSLSVPVST